MKAICTWSGSRGDEEVKLYEGDEVAHWLCLGGEGDGFCYSHQSFKCIDHLTDAEREALAHIEYPEDL